MANGNHGSCTTYIELPDVRLTVEAHAFGNKVIELESNYPDNREIDIDVKKIPPGVRTLRVKWETSDEYWCNHHKRMRHEWK